MQETDIIQAMQAEDLEQVIELQSKTYYEVLPESKASFQNKLSLSPGTNWIIRYNDKEIAAYLAALPIQYNNPPLLNEANYPLSSNPDTLYIHDLSVAPDKQGMQLGSMLVEKVTSTAKIKKLQYVTLIAVQDSLGFWKRFGFKACSSLPQDLQSKISSYGTDACYMGIELRA